MRPPDVAIYVSERTTLRGIEIGSQIRMMDSAGHEVFDGFMTSTHLNLDINSSQWPLKVRVYRDGFAPCDATVSQTPGTSGIRSRPSR